MAANLFLTILIPFLRVHAYLTAPVKSGNRGLLVPRWRRWSGNFGHWAMLFLYLAMALTGVTLLLGSMSYLFAIVIWNR